MAPPAGRPFLRGVNLGSWFVPEAWMTPSFYGRTGASSLCAFVDANRSAAAQQMRQHLNTFVTESDFAWIASHGFNAVRVPVGFWNALGAADGFGGLSPFVPSNPDESLAVLDRMFDWAHAHGLQVLLDLHGAPGSQNGADHSGCDVAGIGWSDGSTTVAMTLKTIEVLAQRFGAHPALLGLELLNEPAWKVEWGHGLLLEFYLRALARIRHYSPSTLVVFNVLFWDQFPAGFGNWWDGQLLEPNVALDLHLYDCYGEASQKSIAEHIDQAHRWREAIDRFQANGHPVLVGEWSLATGVHPGGQAWADAQMDAFSAGIGWFFWSYKKEGLYPGDNGGDTWSLRGALESGVSFEERTRAPNGLGTRVQPVSVKEAGGGDGGSSNVLMHVSAHESSMRTLMSWRLLAAFGGFLSLSLVALFIVGLARALTSAKARHSNKGSSTSAKWRKGETSAAGTEADYIRFDASL